MRIQVNSLNNHSPVPVTQAAPATANAGHVLQQQAAPASGVPAESAAADDTSVAVGAQ